MDSKLKKESRPIGIGPIFTETEVMNSTSQKFLSPSICEYPTLEEDSSPMKNRPEAKTIIGVKKSF